MSYWFQHCCSLYTNINNLASGAETGPIISGPCCWRLPAFFFYVCDGWCLKGFPHFHFCISWPHYRVDWRRCPKRPSTLGREYVDSFSRANPFKPVWLTLPACNAVSLHLMSTSYTRPYGWGLPGCVTCLLKLSDTLLSDGELLWTQKNTLWEAVTSPVMAVAT